LLKVERRNIVQTWSNGGGSETLDRQKMPSAIFSLTQTALTPGFNIPLPVPTLFLFTPDLLVLHIASTKIVSAQSNRFLLPSVDGVP
jgi:hypothetical protein